MGMGERIRAAAAAILTFALLSPIGCGGGNGGGGAGSGGGLGGNATSGGAGGNATSGGAGGNGGAGGANGTGGAVTCTGFDIDVPIATITGSLTVSGAPFAGTEAPRFWFRNDGGDSAVVATAAGAYTARLVPGIYDIYYSAEDPNTLSSRLPINSPARIRTGVVIPKGSSSLNIDIPVATVSRTFTVGGVVPPPTLNNFARIRFRTATPGDVTYVGSVDQGTLTVRLVPGTYDVEYAFQGHDSTLPVNGGAIIRSGVVIPAGTSALNVDIPVATVTGSFTVNGAAVPSATKDGFISIRDAMGNSALIGATGDTTYTTTVVPGTYDVYYGPAVGTASYIHGGKIRTGVVIPSGSSSLDIDVPVGTISGSFTVNGAAMPSTINEGRVMLKNVTGLSSDLGYIGQTTYTARVVPGTYDISYLLATATSPTLPMNDGRIRTGVVIAAGSSTLDIDLPVMTITGTLTVAGGAAPSGNEYGSIHLNHVSTGSNVTLRTNAQSPYTARLIPGNYDVYYNGSSAVSILPLNNKAKLGCISVP